MGQLDRCVVEIAACLVLYNASNRETTQTTLILLQGQEDFLDTVLGDDHHL